MAKSNKQRRIDAKNKEQARKFWIVVGVLTLVFMFFMYFMFSRA